MWRCAWTSARFSHSEEFLIVFRCVSNSGQVRSPRAAFLIALRYDVAVAAVATLVRPVLFMKLLRTALFDNDVV